mmetsp:Transcript_9984/g.17900  ORF Transcript_9984/g.17900 Transcript_9984/m.17900 type:complete len:92 (+) Transcript_9984:110-385(+)
MDPIQPFNCRADKCFCTPQFPAYVPQQLLSLKSGSGHIGIGDSGNPFLGEAVDYLVAFDLLEVAATGCGQGLSTFCNPMCFKPRRWEEQFF